MSVIEEADIKMRQATRYIEYVRDYYPKIHKEALEQAKDDYCPIGMSKCVSCGWTNPEGYPVSGCGSCYRSFTEQYGK